MSSTYCLYSLSLDPLRFNKKKNEVISLYFYVNSKCRSIVLYKYSLQSVSLHTVHCVQTTLSLLSKSPPCAQTAVLKGVIKHSKSDRCQKNIILALIEAFKRKHNTLPTLKDRYAQVTKFLLSCCDCWDNIFLLKVILAKKYMGAQMWTASR